MELESTCPEPVAAARLRRELQRQLCLAIDRSEPSSGRIEYLTDIATRGGLSVPSSFLDVEEFEAWLVSAYRMLSATFLRKLQPQPGDIVARAGSGPPFEVSSIGNDGVIYGKGVGNRGHPNEVEMVARTNAPDYSTAQRSAQIAVAERLKSGTLTDAARAEIEDYRVARVSGTPAQMALEGALRAATSEAPLQQVLEQYPELLSVLVGRKQDVWVIPQKRLAHSYVADFLVAGMTSAGIEWILVELESPTAEMHIADGDFAKQARHGIQQVRDWRIWLEEHLGMARMPRMQDGLGLPGIRANARGVVIVGRSKGVTVTHDSRRHATAEQEGIAVRSYDWLLRANEHPSALGWSSVEADSGFRP